MKKLADMRCGLATVALRHFCAHRASASADKLKACWIYVGADRRFRLDLSA